MQKRHIVDFRRQPRLQHWSVEVQPAERDGAAAATIDRFTEINGVNGDAVYVFDVRLTSETARCIAIRKPVPKRMVDGLG